VGGNETEDRGRRGWRRDKFFPFRNSASDVHNGGLHHRHSAMRPAAKHTEVHSGVKKNYSFMP